jgi:hypothetical protein
MRRSTQSPDSPILSKEDANLPSKDAIDLFGRFVGIVLSTLFEGCFKTFRPDSDFQSEFRRSMSEMFNVGASGSPRDQAYPSGLEDERLKVEAAASAESNPQTGTKSESETETEVESEMAELKRRVSADSACQGDECDRLIALISRSPTFFRVEGDWHYRICPFRENASFDGLISFLTDRSGGNPHDKGLIAVTASTDCSGHEAKNAADLRSGSYFLSLNQSNQWLCYDFKDLRVSVTHYVVGSQGSSAGCNHLRSWVLEGSDDDSEWTELDRRENQCGLNGANATCTFEIRNVIDCRFVRIRSIGPTWYGQHFLRVRALDLFGVVRVPKSLKSICGEFSE